MIAVVVGLAVVLWFGCGLIAYGREFAYWHRGFPRAAEHDLHKDFKESLRSIPFGPFALIYGHKTGLCGFGFKWFPVMDKKK